MRAIRGYLCIVLLLPLLMQALVAASPHSGVMIVEVQTTGVDNNTDQEFVELYNSSNNIIILKGWKLQYLSATGNSWLTKHSLDGYLMPKSTYLLSSSGYLTESADASFSAGFKSDGGHVRVVRPDPTNGDSLIVEDLLGWGKALQPETATALPALAGQSMARKAISQDNYIDTDNNGNDFEIVSPPTPVSTNVIPDNIAELVPQEQESGEEEEPELDVSSNAVLSKKQLKDQSSLAPVIITELLPNPKAPATDSDDEYIELYNPNSQPFYLEEYQLQTGSNFTYDFTFSDEVVPAHGYIVIYSVDSGLSLSNTAGRARLVDPVGNTISQTDPYEKAKEGIAWSLIGGTWQWNAQPTAGQANVLVAPTTTTKKKNSKKKVKERAKKAEVAASTTQNDPSDTGQPTQMNTWIIAGIGVIALGYAVYEYKDDIRSKIFQFRRNRAVRRGAGAAT